MLQNSPLVPLIIVPLFLCCVFSFKVIPGDGLPEQLCSDCCLKIELIENFRIQSIKSYNLLTDIIKSRMNTTADTLISIFDHKLVGYGNAMELESVDETNDDTISITDDYKIDVNDIDEDDSNLEITIDDSEIIFNEIQLEDEKIQDIDTLEVPIEEKDVNISDDVVVADESRSVKCSECCISLQSVKELIEHRRKNHGAKKFQCMDCGNGFTTSRGLRLHSRLHTGEKPEICGVCGKRFADPRTLKCHEKIHTGDFKYSCPLCEKKFPARLPLTNHLRIHTGDKPFKCEICGKCYIQANSLRVCVHQSINQSISTHYSSLFLF